MEKEPNPKAYVASFRQHGQMWHYYGATEEDALRNARCRAFGPNWEGISVSKMPEPEDSNDNLE